MQVEKIKGPVAMLVSSFVFAIGMLATKVATEEVSGEEMAFFRFFFGMLITLIVVFLGHAKISFEKKGMLIARGVFGGLAIIFLFIAVAHGNVTNATVLNNTYPIFATIFAAIYLKERFGWGSVLPLGIAFLGIVLLVHPQVGSVKGADIFALASGLVGGISVVIIRDLRKTMDSWTVFFFLSFFGAFFAAFLAVPKWQWPHGLMWVAVFISAACATIGQLLATWGYKYCTTATGSTISMSTGLFTALFGVVFLGERLNTLEIIGIVMLLASSTYLVLPKKEPIRQIDSIEEKG